MPKKYPNAGWVEAQNPMIGTVWKMVPDVTNFPEKKKLDGPKPLDSEVEFCCFGRLPSTACNPSRNFK